VSAASVAPLHRLLARLLERGTWTASAVIAVGCGLWLARPGLRGPLSGSSVVAGGVALFILLPVARVALLLVVYVRARDRRLAGVAALVLAILAAGLAVGAHHAGAG
jgi:hypothetical protein